MDANSIATLITAFGALLVGIGALSPLLKSMRIAKLGTQQKILMLVGTLSLTFSGIVFAARWFSDRNLPLTEKLTTRAWDALHRSDYATAISVADDCIEFFNKLGDHREKDISNDIATCFLIKGEATEKLGRMSEAIDAYENTMQYRFARVYDPNGRFFWSPAEVASDHLAVLRPSVEIIYPRDGQSVDRRIVVHGKKQNPPSDREVWVFVKSAKSDYYLYPTSSSDPSGEEWQTQICMGQPGSDETNFTIFACPVEPQTRGIFLEDHRPSCEKRILELPSTVRMAECSKRSVYLEPQVSPPVERK